MKMYIFVILFAITACSAVLANPSNFISDGDFSTAVLNPVGSNWSFESENLNKWYTYSSGGTDFYEVSESGYATAALKSQSDRLLFQVIEAPEAGDYNFSFDYRLSDDSDMFSIVRVFEIDDDDSGFSVKTNKWSGSFSNMTSATSIYDQGGSDSYLSTASDWTNVSSTISVSESSDYLIIYAVFSHDGTTYSLLNENADLDNFSITPTVPAPGAAVLCMLGLSGLSLIKKRMDHSC